MTVVFFVTLSLLSLAALASLVRILRGPTILDRIVGLDMLVVVIVSGIAVEGAWRRQSANIVLLVVVALLGFLSSLAVVRLTGGEDRR